MDRRTPYEVWRDNVQSATSDELREALIEVGLAEGWVGPDGEVLDPNATSIDRLNADIRRAAGRIATPPSPTDDLNAAIRRQPGGR